MSAYRVHKSQIKNRESILEAIADLVSRNCHIPIEQARELVEKNIECHDEPVNLYGYKDDIRDDMAHIVARRSFVRRYMGGGASNDAGWLLTEDGTYHAAISDYDIGRWWGVAQPRFWQIAMTNEAILEAKAGGCALHRTEEKGNIKLEAVMVGSQGSTHSGGAW